ASVARLDYLNQQLMGVRGIRNFSFSSNTPIEDDNDNWTKFFFDHSAKQTSFYAILKWTDARYIPTYKLPLVAGRNLEPSDTPREFVVNEDLLRNLGIVHPGDALNKEIILNGGAIKGPIVGVVKDFNDRSFRRPLAPLLMVTGKEGYQEAGIRLTTSDILPTMKAIESIWNKTFPDYVFSYQFLDEKIAGFYKQEHQLSDLYRIFAIIAIFLSCLGLYGLASFMAIQRVKEVGIRKVLGASTSQIVYLFCREFVLLIMLAFVIATPLTWYYMHQWLQNYPFRIKVTLWLFLAGGALTLSIALVTVSIQSIRAAVANPVQSLRSE
ncbi:MAG TPA: FtsX-like permease family protein, partial [Chitinophagaceae bacterium]|nr:FtsX-like permease family protein [Chitinophagaceae bacterium]